LLDHSDEYRRMASIKNPYGDGKASERIIQILLEMERDLPLSDEYSTTEIVYIAVNQWDSMTQREQHLLTGLSRTYRVLFVDPPLSFLTILAER